MAEGGAIKDDFSLRLCRFSDCMPSYFFSLYSLSLCLRFIIPILVTQTATLLLNVSPGVFIVYRSSFSYRQVRVGATCHALIVAQKSCKISMGCEDV